MLLYAAEASAGGIAEYALYQGLALHQLEPGTRFLCRPDFPMDRLGSLPVLPEFPPRKEKKSRIGRLLAYVQDSRQLAE